MRLSRWCPLACGNEARCPGVRPGASWVKTASDIARLRCLENGIGIVVPVHAGPRHAKGTLRNVLAIISMDAEESGSCSEPEVRPSVQDSCAVFTGMRTQRD